MSFKVGVVIASLSKINIETDFKTLVQRTLPFLQDCFDFSLNIIIEEHFTNAYQLDSCLGHIYSTARDVLLSKQYYFTQINVLFNMAEVQTTYDVLFAYDNKMSSYQYKSIQLYQLSDIPSSSNDMYESLNQNQYSVSAVGGTFDHMHDGHKILLSVASFITKVKLIIGLTDQELLVNKKHKGLLESFDVRSKNVSQFLRVLKPGLNLEIIAIRDVCGPTGTVPDIEALIVSRETLAGGKFVNNTRSERGLSQLDIVVVNVLGGREEDGWKEKMSSTCLLYTSRCV